MKDYTLTAEVEGDLYEKFLDICTGYGIKKRGTGSKLQLIKNFIMTDAIQNCITNPDYLIKIVKGIE